MAFKNRRNSLRLKGYDYSQPGEYFVTICTRDRKCVLGTVENGKMRLSELGKIVDAYWRKVPEDFPNMRLGGFQIMPNHMHGVIQIKEDGRQSTKESCRGLINQTPTTVDTGGDWILMRNPKTPLGKVIRSFKARCTRLIHEAGHPTFGWQRNYYDHIIRDDIDHFLVEQYIELNPILWSLDIDNPGWGGASIDDLREELKTQHGLTGFALERVIEHEVEYRNWRDNGTEAPLTA